MSLSPTNPNDPCAGDGDDARDANEIAYDDVTLELPDHPVSEADVADDDVELWLVRVPKHDSLVDALVGKTISTSVARGKRATGDTLAGRVRGSYNFRDHGATPTRGMRAVFVVPKTDGGKGGSDGDGGDDGQQAQLSIGASQALFFSRAGDELLPLPMR